MGWGCSLQVPSAVLHVQVMDHLIREMEKRLMECKDKTIEQMQRTNQEMQERMQGELRHMQRQVQVERGHKNARSLIGKLPQRLSGTQWPLSSSAS